MTDQQIQDLANAAESLGAALAFHVRDHSLDKRDAWVYEILIGWKSALPEVAAKHGWDEDTLARLKAYRLAFAALHTGFPPQRIDYQHGLLSRAWRLTPEPLQRPKGDG